MLSQFDNDSHNRIRRSKSAASVKERRKVSIIPGPVNLETNRVHAIIAAHRAMDRSRGSVSISEDLSRSDSSASKRSVRLTNARNAGSSHTTSALRREGSHLKVKLPQFAGSLPVRSRNDQARDFGSHHSQIPFSEFGANFEGEPSSYKKLRKARSVLHPSHG